MAPALLRMASYARIERRFAGVIVGVGAAVGIHIRVIVGVGGAVGRAVGCHVPRVGWEGSVLVATGRADIMVDPIMNEWDCGPFIPILQEAGGYFGDWQGNPTIYGNEAMATTQTLLPQVLKIIKG